jgi:Cytidine deaminase
MKQYTLAITVQEAESRADLPLDDKVLLKAAEKALESAYAPFSTFQVGAAVRLSDGSVVTGSNQENAAFPSGLCAERTALFYAHAQYPHLKVEAIAITAATEGVLVAEPVYPCGACRQVMLESEKRAGKPVRVIMGSRGKVQIVEGIGALLPLSFIEVPQKV